MYHFFGMTLPRCKPMKHFIEKFGFIRGNHVAVAGYGSHKDSDGWLCFTSHRQRVHLEMAPPYTVPCERREARSLQRSHRELNPGPSHGSALHYLCTTPAPLKTVNSSSQHVVMQAVFFQYVGEGTMSTSKGKYSRYIIVKRGHFLLFSNLMRVDCRLIIRVFIFPHFTLT